MKARVSFTPLLKSKVKMDAPPLGKFSRTTRDPDDQAERDDRPFPSASDWSEILPPPSCSRHGDQGAGTESPHPAAAGRHVTAHHEVEAQLAHCPLSFRNSSIGLICLYCGKNVFQQKIPLFRLTLSRRSPEPHPLLLPLLPPEQRQKSPPAA